MSRDPRKLPKIEDGKIRLSQRMRIQLSHDGPCPECNKMTDRRIPCNYCDAFDGGCCDIEELEVEFIPEEDDEDEE